VTEIAVADIGGTNARFARAAIGADGAIALSEPSVLGTGDYTTFAEAWGAFLALNPGFEPQGVSLALAGPASQGRFKLTNADWTFDPASLPGEIGVEQVMLLNDFEAIAHGIADDTDEAHLTQLAGPSAPFPDDQAITIIGPGTGLGIAHFRRHSTPIGLQSIVQPTEGSHIGFAPVDEVDDAALAALRQLHDRVSLERVLSGEGIAHIYTAVAAVSGTSVSAVPKALDVWKSGMAGSDPIAERAVAHFVKTLGRIASDYALAHGAGGVVIAGGLGLRLQDHLTAPAFHEAFLAKGRYRTMMEGIPIKLVTHPQPGLLGAAAAFAQTHMKASPA